LLLAALLLLSGSAPSSSTAAPERQADVDLDAAPWEFETDPRDVGVVEQWFSSKAKPALERTLTSPGAWQAQGVGNETALMHNQYAGVGWYRKTLTVGAVPAGGSVWLWIGGAPGGVMRSANVWANGVHCGRHVGYLEPLEIELTPALDHTGGGLELAVAVDSRWNRTEDPLWGGGSMWNYGWDGYNFGGYGGMIGNAKLLVRQPAWIEDSVHVSCKDAGGGSWQCAVKLTVAGRVSGARVSLAICEWGSSSGGTGCIVGAQTAANASRMTLTLTIPNAKLWAPGTQAAQAALYVANLTLSVGGSSDASPATTRSTRFGVRSLDTNGPRILFNGEPLFLRGYGDDGQYGFTGAPPMDKGYYLAQLSGMRELGFNFIRFHTHAMPDVFHEAADELGFLCNPEFAMNYRVGCPFPGCVYNEEVHDTYNRSFASIVHRRSHHPSVFGAKSPLLSHFNTQNDHLTKTGSRQTLGKPKTRGVFCRVRPQQRDRILDSAVCRAVPFRERARPRATVLVCGRRDPHRWDESDRACLPRWAGRCGWILLR
jgi:beta-galactosidase/beta-glucuronidase